MEEFLNNLESNGTDFDIEKSNVLDDFANNLESNEGVETNEISEENDVFVDEFPDKSSEDKSLKNDDNVFVDDFPNKDVTEYSKELVEQMNSSKEKNIYKEAQLEEKEVNGKLCLTRTDINPNLTDEFGRTNEQRMDAGYAPLDKDGKSIELHHIGQKNDGGLAELTSHEHGRGKGNKNYDILHDRTKESEIDRKEFSLIRANHWRSRANDYK